VLKKQKEAQKEEGKGNKEEDKERLIINYLVG
jgi:hypothetical protein